MAVLERTYKRYEGRLSPEWSRFLIIPRHAYVDVFRSKLFTAFFALSFLYPLVCSILIYLHYNTTVLGLQKLHLDQLLPIDASFFKFYVVWQGITGFFLVMLVAPQQVARDLTNNGLPLYLCRPFSCSEYVVRSRATCCGRSEEHTSELQSLTKLVCRLLLEKIHL